MKKKVFGFMVACLAGICAFSNSKVYAAEVEDEIVYATEFVSELVEEDDYYSEWEGAEIEYAYTLYTDDLETVAGNLYYVKADGQTEGYLIVDDKLTVAEFSKSEPAYDLSDVPLDEYTKYVYSNAMPAIAVDETLYRISMSGEILNLSSDISLFYDPQLQGEDNCIVTAISNLIWDWGIEEFPELIEGMTFQDVKETIDELMLAEDDEYANDNIPATIKNYVSDKNCSATVTNKWNPSFSAVKNETVYRPCLLGFAAMKGSYDKIEGHMTVCVGTKTVGSQKYCKVMDGWEEKIVEKQWGSYNDFMAKVIIR